MKLFTSIMLLGCLAVGQAHAESGDRAGNGGDGVVCRDASGRILSVELLDFYEARIRGIVPDFGPTTGADYKEKIRFALQRFGQVAPKRAVRYQNVAEHFESEALFLRNAQLVDIPDSEHIALPAGCAVEQLVIQKAPELPEDKLYTVNGDLWDLLSDEGKAGLVLHEAIFREAISYNHVNSILVRYLNSYIVSGKLNGMNSKQRIEFFQLVKFHTAEAQGFEINVGFSGSRRGDHFLPAQPYARCTNISFNDNGTVSRATLSFGSQTVQALGVEFQVNGSELCNFASRDAIVEFWSDGTLQFFWGKREDWTPIGESGRFSAFFGTPISLWPNGRVRRIELIPTGGGEFVSHGRTFWIAGDLEFSEDGTFVQAAPVAPDRLHLFVGVIGTSVRGGIVCWDHLPDWSAPTWTARVQKVAEMSIGGRTVSVKGEFVFDPHHDDKVIKAQLAMDAVLRGSDGRQRKYNSGCVLVFDDLERVSSVENCR